MKKKILVNQSNFFRKYFHYINNDYFLFSGLMNSNLMVMTGVKTPHFGIMALKVLELEQADKVVTNLKCLETSPI